MILVSVEYSLSSNLRLRYLVWPFFIQTMVKVYSVTLFFYTVDLLPNLMYFLLILTGSWKYWFESWGISQDVWE